MRHPKLLVAALCLALAAAAPVAAQLAETLLAQEKNWKASLFHQPGTGTASCAGFIEEPRLGEMFGVQYIRGAGFYVMLRLPRLEAMPPETTFLVSVGESRYPLRGRNYGNEDPSGVLYLMPVKEPSLFSSLLRDLAKGTTAEVVSPQMSRQLSYSLSGSKVAIDAFFQCSQRMIAAG